MPPAAPPRGRRTTGPANGQVNGQGGSSAPPDPGRRKPNRALQELRDNPLQTTEELSAYVNTARRELFARADELDALAAEFHGAIVQLRKRLLRAAKKTKNPKERFAYRKMVRSSLKPFRQASRAAADASTSAADSARGLRRFWRVYVGIWTSVVPTRRGEK